MTDIIIYNDKEIVPSNLFKSDGLESFLKEVAKEVDAFEADETSEDGRKEIKSFAKKISLTKNKLDAEAFKLTESHRQIVSKVNATRKNCKETMSGYQGRVLAPLKAWEERIANIRARIESFEEDAIYVENNFTTILMSEFENAINNINLDEFQYQEFSQKAAKVKALCLEVIKAKCAERIKIDTERKELEELRRKEAERAQKERDNQLRKEERERVELEEKAKALALEVRNKERESNLLLAKKEAEEKAKQAAIDSELAIKKLQQEAKKREQEQKEEAKRLAKQAIIDAQLALQEALRKKEEEAKRIKEKEELELKKKEDDKKHIKQKKQESIKALSKLLDINQDDIIKLIDVVFENKVPNIKFVL